MAKARRLAHELEERRALVGLVRVRPAEGVLSPPAQGTREALVPDAGAFPALARVGGLGPALRAWSLAWERQATFLGETEPRAARPGRFLPRE
jgi:hypothetical protein